MNFKPNSWKLIVSLVVFIFSYLTIYKITSCVRGSYCGNPTSTEILGYSLIIGFLVYVIWSLIEKPKNKRQGVEKVKSRKRKK